MSLPMILSFCSRAEQTSSLRYLSSLERSNKVSSSANEPNAMLRKFMNSFADLRPAPSAMFEGKDTAALLICDVNPNLSSDGKVAVAEYTSVTNSKLNFHASSVLCGLSFIKNKVLTKIKVYVSHLTNNISQL